MEIANPIYDVVFKYLMNDNKIAKLIISHIIGEKVVSLEPKPQEHVVIVEGQIQSWTVIHFDFAARIKTPKGYKQIIVEIQKAKLPADIMRFRRYLGQQYQDEKNVCIETVKGEDIKHALPIVSIYFLGHKLDHAKDIPLIKVNRKYYDAATGDELTHREEFIESLTHDSFVVQIPYLHQQRRTEAEKLLSIFDQDYITDSQHILNVDENQFPKEYRDIIRCLRKAIEQEEVRNAMIGEDEIIEGFQSLERAIAYRDKALLESAKALEEKDRLIEELKKKLEG